MIKYFNLNGIPSTEQTNNSVAYEWKVNDLINEFSILNKDNTTDIDFKLITLTHKIAEKIFGSYQKLYKLLMSKTTVYSYAGIDAEIQISKQEFEKWVKSDNSEDHNKILFYYDFQNLIGSLQNLVQESKFLFYEFYKTLNENSFMLNNTPLKPNGLMFASGKIVTNIFSKINHLFINLVSQLDFITKIAFEFENFKSDFTDYPKLKSNKILYGQSINLKQIPEANTLFEKTNDIKLIISLRNEIIHNSSFENIPKVYQVFENDILIEKFIFIPDSTDGILDSYKNRNRFFGNDIKLNEILPDLVTSFWDKMEKTIDSLIKL